MKENNEIVRGFKVFNPDWTCRGFRYKVGEEYTWEHGIGLCSAGFHFCRKAAACFNYYQFDKKNKVAEVEAHGRIIDDEYKVVTDRIRIVRELSWAEVLDLVNTGDGCTGRGNTGGRCSGNWNSGSRNSGDRNTGSRNVGDDNSGEWNAGDHNAGCGNIGDGNSGHCNYGSFNTGWCNPGSFNSGDWNAGDWNSGFFNTRTPLVTAFNKPTGMIHSEFERLPGVQALRRNYEIARWIDLDHLTPEDEMLFPNRKTLGGGLRHYGFNDACQRMWREMTPEERESVLAIPNFDPAIFKEITGIDVNAPMKKGNSV